MEAIFDRHLVDLQTPKQGTENEEADFEKFRSRFSLFVREGFAASLTDNPLGRISYTAPETVEFCELTIDPAAVVYHLNTFHRKETATAQSGGGDLRNEQDLDVFLQHAADQGLQRLVVVSGDGSDRLPRLQPEDVGCDPKTVQTVTSIQLLGYIHRTYPGRFLTGVAFNQYEPVEHEIEKLKHKLDAGASYVITQPCIFGSGSSASRQALDAMMDLARERRVQPILGVWISKKYAHLLPMCVGLDFDVSDFDPWETMDLVLKDYPGIFHYYSMVFQPETIAKIKERLNRSGSQGSA